MNRPIWILLLLTFIGLQSCAVGDRAEGVLVTDTPQPAVETPTPVPGTPTPSSTYPPAEIAQVTTFARRTEFANNQATARVISAQAATARSEELATEQAWLDILALTPTPMIPDFVSLDKLDLPDWMADAKTNILFVPIGNYDDGFKHLALIDPVSGERYELNVQDIGAYFWLEDGTGFGLLSQDGRAMAIVDLGTGAVYHYPAPEKIFYYEVRDRSYYGPKRMVAFGDPSNPSDFVLADPGRVSFDGQYIYLVAEGKYSLDDTTTIINVKTGEEFQLTEFDDDKYDAYHIWSPVMPYLAFAEGDGLIETNFVDHYAHYTLQIYDAGTGVLVGAYEDMSYVVWSRDGAKLLHTQKPFRFDQPNVPCIFDLLTGETTCFNEVHVHHPSGASTLNYAWSPDMQQISYAYSTVVDISGHHEGGFCLIAIATREIECPIDPFDYYYSSGDLAHNYAWSPDGRYVAMHLEPRGFGGDDGSTPRLAVLDLTTNEHEILGQYLGGTAGIWRPMP
ncbi:MAG: hypothetical protein JXB38_18125 [Anaerolineales bacterium]|nr:hypothetical protein [Anaerolineales bacterium]